MANPYKNSPNLDTKKVFAEGLQDGSAIVQAHMFLYDTSLLSWVAQTGTYSGGGNVTVNNYVSPTNYIPILYVDGDIKYICKALPGTNKSDAAWQIMKIDTASGLIGGYANGNANFVNRATDLNTVKGYDYS